MNGNAFSDDEAKSRVYVGNLVPQANEMDVQNALTEFGPIDNVWIARKPPGFAFVVFEKPEYARKAVLAWEKANDKIEIRGKAVKIRIAVQKGERSINNSADHTFSNHKVPKSHQSYRKRRRSRSVSTSPSSKHRYNSSNRYRLEIEDEKYNRDKHKKSLRSTHQSNSRRYSRSRSRTRRYSRGRSRDRKYYRFHQRRRSSSPRR